MESCSSLTVQTKRESKKLEMNWVYLSPLHSYSRPLYRKDLHVWRSQRSSHSYLCKQTRFGCISLISILLILSVGRHRPQLSLYYAKARHWKQSYQSWSQFSTYFLLNLVFSPLKDSFDDSEGIKQSILWLITAASKTQRAINHRPL